MAARRVTKNPNKPRGRQFQNTRVPMGRAGTSRKKLPVPAPPKNLAPVHGEGYAGRI